MADVSLIAHRPLAEILEALPDSIATPALAYPGVRELIDLETIEDEQLRQALAKRYAGIIEPG